MKEGEEKTSIGTELVGKEKKKIIMEFCTYKKKKKKRCLQSSLCFGKISDA